ncbi:MAG: hypothetical protein A2087_14765 [Spirochaetes bacterium GWD1_61_31]|nr:MAG: hypothetical protein A2Y37_12890 [Spirochaetes bacterium GWB1_60_80]OHD28679.1 MAG: hypothetical protein A2004_05840 [Spirochaetes bacterium GWC1_61_12]OHD38899.1 MAG: hypothetical protein A2087_14765 [Spirochaetes bacterium GWD1_61_31]OHD43322.1 MAG: hypothetical protein A2Y35_08585 [Spirochaetes bacterium GWE1_60_18]OHD58860.1 MAG: hypothetical protein A2Y32_08955 [Spirochaetes bacterium GWF1_60_12]HAP42514.1 UDP-4-amino-4,6-dideoxy-N-acetyl-beta-L-altrosamine transaminase [Spirochae
MKANTDLASLEPIPFARPDIGPEEEAAVLRIMRSGWLTTGAETLAFEQAFAAFVGSPHALAVNSATSGLHLALEALGIGPGDTVITSPYTFTSSAAVILHQRAEVVFCDTAPGSANLDPLALEQVLAKTRNVRAIIAVHVGGLPCDMDAILALAANYGCAVIEDAAHAFPVRSGSAGARDGAAGAHDGAAWAGTRGTIGVYSFYATKTITTGDGGMVVTADPKLAARMALMRMHGIDRTVWSRYTDTKASWQYNVTEAGFKYNLPDILSAIGKVQLGRALGFVAERQAIAALYNQRFAGLPGLSLPPGAEFAGSAAGPDIRHAWHLYALRVGDGQSDQPRNRLGGYLQAAGIGVSVHFIPLHLMPFYAVRYQLTPEDFPNALRTYRQSLSLPIWQGMGLERASRVADAVVAGTNG